MGEPKDKTKRHRAFRKRVKDFFKVPFVAEQIAWRLTAGWFWICALAIVFQFWTRLNIWEDARFMELNGALMRLGFAPSNPYIFSKCVKLLWLFAICEFSWIQVIGFFIYVLPCPLFFRLGSPLGIKWGPIVRKETNRSRHRAMLVQSFPNGLGTGKSTPRRKRRQ